MNALTFWWSKYQKIREIKKAYEKEAKNCQYPSQLKQEYLDRFLEAIK